VSLPGARDAEPGAVLLHPLTLAFLALWIVNDHVLKAAYPGLVSGKLSDIAGVIVFPLLVLAGAELLGSTLSQRRRRAVLGCAVIATCSAMIAIKLFEPAAWFYREGLAALQWPFYAALSALRGSALPELRSVNLAMDPTDLLTLPSSCVALWIAESTHKPESHIRARSPSSVV